MLIYDHTKKLIGIDDDDLHLLGFHSAEALFEACEDIADFFVKEPGYIHNFKNFQWIDFVLHADSQNSNVLIDTGNLRLSGELLIKPFHLAATPDREAYAVYLQHLKPVTGATRTEPATQPETPPRPPEPPKVPEPETIEEPELAFESEPELDLPRFDDVEPTVLDDVGSSDLSEEPAFYEPDDALPAEFIHPPEIEEDLFVPEKEPAVSDVDHAIDALVPKTPEPSLPFSGYLSPEELAYTHPLGAFTDYRYDPRIAADELGLPVDLIEEFIGDFITQAHEFQAPLFEAVEKGDYENLKLLSHKLKGVAANLRIEDAFAILTTINTSHTHDELTAYLKVFYRTALVKLEGKAPEAAPAPEIAEPPFAAAAPETPAATETVPTETSPAPQTEEDIYAFDIKEPSAEQQHRRPETDTSDIYAFDLPAHEPIEPDTPSPLPEPPAEAAVELPEFDPFSEPADTGMESEPVPEMFPVEPAAESQIPGGEQESPPYDAHSVALELGLPTEIVEELKKDFIDHAEQCRNALKSSIDTADAAQWRAKAIELKGIADNLRMNDIAELLQQLEGSSDPIQAETLIEGFYRRLGTL